MVTFRSAKDTDISIIAQLSRQLGYDTTEKLTEQYLNQINKLDDTVVIVAFINDLVVVWMQVSDIIRLESGRFCEIVGLVVSESCRGKGIGKQLIE